MSQMYCDLSGYWLHRTLDKGKPVERWGRKTSGLRIRIYDSGVAKDERVQEHARTFVRASKHPIRIRAHVALPER